METNDIYQTIFLTFIMASFFKLFELIIGFFIKGFMKFSYDATVLFVILIISGWITLVFGIIVVYPKILNLKNEFIMRDVKKIAKGAFIISFLIILLLLIFSVIART